MSIVSQKLQSGMDGPPPYYPENPVGGKFARRARLGMRVKVEHTLPLPDGSPRYFDGIVTGFGNGCLAFKNLDQNPDMKNTPPFLLTIQISFYSYPSQPGSTIPHPNCVSCIGVFEGCECVKRDKTYAIPVDAAYAVNDRVMFFIPYHGWRNAVIKSFDERNPRMARVRILSQPVAKEGSPYEYCAGHKMNVDIDDSFMRRSEFYRTTMDVRLLLNANPKGWDSVLKQVKDQDSGKYQMEPMKTLWAITDKSKVHVIKDHQCHKAYFPPDSAVCNEAPQKSAASPPKKMKLSSKEAEKTPAKPAGEVVKSAAGANKERAGEVRRLEKERAGEGKKPEKEVVKSTAGANRRLDVKPADEGKKRESLLSSDVVAQKKARKTENNYSYHNASIWMLSAPPSPPLAPQQPPQSNEGVQGVDAPPQPQSVADNEGVDAPPQPQSVADNEGVDAPPLSPQPQSVADNEGVQGIDVPQFSVADLDEVSFASRFAHQEFNDPEIVYGLLFGGDIQAAAADAEIEIGGTLSKTAEAVDADVGEASAEEADEASAEEADEADEEKAEEAEEADEEKAEEADEEKAEEAEEADEEKAEEAEEADEEKAEEEADEADEEKDAEEAEEAYEEEVDELDELDWC